MRIAAVILAAGKSSRMGGPNKVLALLNGTPLVSRATEQAKQSHCNEIFVVTGRDAERVELALESFSLEIVRNSNFEEGMGTSISIAAQKLLDAPEPFEALILMFADMPLITATHINSLIEACLTDPNSIHRAADGTVPGHPVLFPESHFTALAALTGDVGPKDLTRNAKLLDIGKAAVIDVDTPEALIQASGSLDFF